jgi:hypothetical protein
MTDFGDESLSGSEEPNIMGQSRQGLWSWNNLWSSNNLVPVLMLALPGPFLLAVMMLVKPEYGMTLFKNPIGLKMLAFATVQQLIGMVVHISWKQVDKKAPRWLSTLIVIGVVIFFYLGFMFVVVVGPAAIAIYERLPRK